MIQPEQRSVPYVVKNGHFFSHLLIHLSLGAKSLDRIETARSACGDDPGHDTGQEAHAERRGYEYARRVHGEPRYRRAKKPT